MILPAATPIGDVADASPRFIHTFDEAEIIATEDACRLLSLANRLQTRTTGTLINLHDHNEADKAERLIDLAEGGARVLLASDAGMPTVPDPGFRIVRVAVNRGVQASALPGPSVPITALAVSGLPSDRFSFGGLLPRRPGEAQAHLLALTHDPYTLIFFESPKRLNETLRAMTTAFSPRCQRVVCRKPTKAHGETLRDGLELLVKQTTGEVLEEIAIVIAGYRERGDAEEHVPAILALASEGMRLKDTVAEIAEATGLCKNELYKAALCRKEKG